ncbi:hypothetical protein LUZ61_001081 [Rhynchospora tenuis]|uniref:Uncharacterized protein n=1 Tax=Rhynchospora tenuis TaxID=198213 RepID=A0AAD6EQI8_9POAL|nr:hypothetical protein LUZ61_001081 [Rhynchospora tenuis]
MAINLADYHLNIVVVATHESEHLPEVTHLATSITELGHNVCFASTLPGLKAIRVDPSNPNSSRLELIPLREDNVREAFYTFLQQAGREFDWILFDITTFWVPEITENIGIYSAFISFQSASTSQFLLTAMNRNEIPSIEDLMPQNLGARTYHSKEAKAVLDQLMKCDAQKVPLYSRLRKAIYWCDVVALSSYSDIEDELPKKLTRTHKKYFSCIGHLPQTTSSEVSSSNYVMNSATVQEWLDKNNVGSVVYVALEDKMPITDQQVDAIAQGLERSRVPFIWVTGSRKGGLLHNLPAGFRERTIDYGFVCTDWVAPANILSHLSVGGFLTNGNWTSWIEALDFGIPLILAPFPTDGVHNAKVIQAKKIGYEVERDGTGKFDGDHVAKALNYVMVDQGGNTVREQAKAMRGVFRSLQTPCLSNFLDGLDEIKESRALSNRLFKGKKKLL